MILYTYECSQCGETFYEFHDSNSTKVTYHCTVAQMPQLGFNTHKDTMYKFTRQGNNGVPIEINSKSKYKKYLKDNGLVQATKDNRKVKRKNDLKETAKKVAKECIDKVHAKGAMNWCLGKEGNK